MENEIYILKTDLIKCCKKIAGVGEAYFDEDFLNDLNKIINQASVFKEEYVHRDIIGSILDVVFEYTQHSGDDYDDIADEIEALPSVRFVKSYDKETVYREDVISFITELLEREYCSIGDPAYEAIINTINSVPILKLED